MEYVNAMLTSIEPLKALWSSISNYFNYHEILDENQQDIIELENAQTQKKFKKEVEYWLAELEVVKDNAQQIEQEVGETRYFSRFSFLSQIESNTRKLDEMSELGEFPNGILVDAAQDKGNTLLTAQLIGETTAKRNLGKIWHWSLGNGGIGKTIVVTHIYNRLLENNSLFGYVYWVTVSKESSIRELQDAIAKKLKIDFSEERTIKELFNKTLGRDDALNVENKKIAKDIVKECVGLPLAIVITAKSMRRVRGICEWRNALNELRGRTQGLTLNMEDDVFKILELSYYRLKGEELRECLLHYALFPEDYEIRRVSLIKYWIAEGIVGEMETRQAEFDKRHAIPNKLENVCLLERCGKGKCVKMHDVIRDMAINISKKNSRFMVKTGRNLNDLLSKIQWLKELERVFFTEINLPNAFFGHMPSLKVLNLSYASISFLPNSISNLVNLRALFLCHCKNLDHVPSLAKLKELRELDLSDSGITKLPDGIEQLVLLKRLDLQGLLIEDMSLNKALPKLLHLQCLRLDDMIAPIVMEELIGLRVLKILVIYLSSLHEFDSYMRTKHYERLTHYYFQICDGVWPPGNSPDREVDNFPGWDGGPRYVFSREVALRRCELKQGRKDHQLMLPTNIQVLEIEDGSLPTSLLDLDVSPSLKDAEDLKVCSISECEGIEYLWWIEDWVASLNNMYLTQLPNLSAIFKFRPTNIVSCSNLKHLSCGNLKHLFTPELVKYHIQNLEVISIQSCIGMEDIIVVAEVEEEGEDINEMNNLVLYFPNLRCLELQRLPQLKSIWKGTMTCDSLQQLIVLDFPKLRRLPLLVHTTDGDGERRASTPPLKQIKGHEEWWNVVEWDTHPHAKSVFQPLFLPNTRHDLKDILDEVYL
ncbi:hypothetical protein PVL29_015829 [Vitis rotundifolia]|uniref:NB-ARC domain-containing protein n=1 Tax=Vitis rotundifolia TaxID=103349 RepID=A0AA38ZDQ2_VITRO|nr:hypothetical protein PVL29_015829 [Vitis rotundifolia]